MGGDVAARIGAGKVEPKLAVGIRRQHGRADANGLDARLLAEGGDAAAARRAHEERRLFRRDPQRLDRQRRMQRARNVEKQRHAAHDLILRREPIDRAPALGGAAARTGSACTPPRKAGTKSFGSSPAMAKRAMGSRGLAATALSPARPSTTGTLAISAARRSSFEGRARDQVVRGRRARARSGRGGRSRPATGGPARRE